LVIVRSAVACGDDFFRGGLIGCSLSAALAAEVVAGVVGARGSESRPPSPATTARKRASTTQYGSGLKSANLLLATRQDREASASARDRVTTAPFEGASQPDRAARVAFMPTIQSASERERAASSSVWYFLRGLQRRERLL